MRHCQRFWNLFIHFTVCCRNSRLGPGASLITKQREKQQQKWEQWLLIQWVLYNLLEHCWYCATCRSVCVCSGVNICIASLCLHGCFCFLCLYKLVLKAGTSHLWSCESLKFHPNSLPGIHSCTQREQVNKTSVTGRRAMLLCSCVSFHFSSMKDPI